MGQKITVMSITNDLSADSSFRSSFNFTEGKGLESTGLSRRICYVVTINSHILGMNTYILNYPFGVPGVFCTVEQCTLVKFGMGG